MQSLNHDKSHAVAFTGYRTAKIMRSTQRADILEEISRELRREILAHYEAGFRLFISGGSEGFDLMAAESVVALREQLPEIKLLMAIPYRAQSAAYTPEQKASYERMLQLSDVVEMLSEQFWSGVFHTRNDYMLHHSSALICYYDGQSGGTMYTYNRAMKLGHKVTNLCNYQEQLSLEF